MSLGAVIVGGSVAGTRVARGLRENGYRDRVTILEAESHLPYDKPPLSKASLSALKPAPVPLITEAEARDLDIDLRLGVRATRLDLDAALVHTSDGESIAYGELTIATGVSARPSPWGYPPGVHLLRSLDDAATVRAALERGGSVVIIGAGFIGSEIASAARQRGLDVTLLDSLPVPMARLLGDEIGRRFVHLHQDQGVDARFGIGVQAIEREDHELVVRLDDGSMLRPTAVIVGIGTVLNTDWLEGSGLLLDDGVACDEFCRAVGRPNVYAAGDTARWWHRRHARSVRTEHWTNAIEQAACVAWNITHPDEPRVYEPIEYVWSDQYDWKVHILGCPDPLSTPTVIDDSAHGRFVAWWTSRDGAVAAGVTVNWSKASVMLRRAIASQASAPDVLARAAPERVTT